MLGSISSRCSENEPALRGPATRERGKSSLTTCVDQFIITAKPYFPLFSILRREPKEKNTQDYVLFFVAKMNYLNYPNLQYIDVYQGVFPFQLVFKYYSFNIYKVLVKNWVSELWIMQGDLRCHKISFRAPSRDLPEVKNIPFTNRGPNIIARTLFF